VIFLQYIYPCILTPEKVGGYSVAFPDISGGTQGETLAEALFMAEDMARLEVKVLLAENETPKTPTLPEKVKVPAGAFMTLIKVDTEN